MSQIQNIKVAHDIRLHEVKKDPTVKTEGRADAFKNPGGNTTLPEGCGPTEAQYHAAKAAKGEGMTLEDLEADEKKGYSGILSKIFGVGQKRGL